MTSSKQTLAAAPSRRRSRRSELPVVFRWQVWLPIVAVAVLAWFIQSAWKQWQAGHIVVRVTDTDGRLLPEVELELFRNRPDAAAPTPTERLALLHSDGEPLTLDVDEVPGSALLRVSAPGMGRSYGVAELGRGPLELQLAPPTIYRGTVVDAATREPVLGASVRAFGGGVRGVLLDEATTAADGSYEFARIAENVTLVALLVLAQGYAVLERWQHPAEPPPTIELQRTAIVHGKLVPPADRPGFEVGGREIRVYQVPGVAVRTVADGSFELDHLPPSPTVCTLIVGELEPDLTHRRCRAISGGRDVTIRLETAGTISGYVVDRRMRNRLARAKVYHEHGPSGLEVVESDELGNFSLGRVPAGAIVLSAHLLIDVPPELRTSLNEYKRLRQGGIALDLDPGQTVGDVVVPID